MSEEPTALRLADALDMHWIEHSRCHPNDSPMCEAAAAELRRLHDELKECQDQRRAAFRRIEELDRELDAMRAQIGQGVPMAWCLGNPMYADSSNVFLANEFTPDGEHEHEWTPLYTHPAPQQKPLTTQEIDSVMRKSLGYGLSPIRDDLELVRAIEAAHGIK